MSYMKSVLLYGKEDLRIEEVPVPKVGPGEVLVKVKCALTCGTDLKILKRGEHMMIGSLPSPFGHEFSGVVEDVGDDVEGISPGMRVVAANSAPCSRCPYCREGRSNLCDALLFLNGAYAQYVLVPSRIVKCNTYPLPDGLGYVDAAMTEPLACVLHGIERCRIEAGQTVCVLGLGPIGLLFVAVAGGLGAKVIAVGRGRWKLDKAKSLGAWKVVDLSVSKDPVEDLRDLSPDSRGADVIIEAVGRPETWEMAIRMARKGGLVNLFGGCPKGSRVRIDPYELHYEEKWIISVFHHTPHYVAMALELLSRDSRLAEELVTHRLPLDELPTAFKLMERGRSLKVAILPHGDPS